MSSTLSQKYSICSDRFTHNSWSNGQMSESDREQRIAKLIKLHMAIAQDFQDLNNNTSEIYQTHLAQLETIRQRKLQQLEEWGENERKSAEKYHEGQYYAIENDYSERVRQINTRVNDFLAFKIELLKEKFPEAAEYFESKGYKWPAKELVQEPPLHLAPDVEVTATDQPLLTKEEAAEDIQMIHKIASGTFDGRAHLKGMGSGARAILQLPNMPPVAGSIGKIATDHFEFKRSGGRTLNISFRALELQHASVLPE